MSSLLLQESLRIAFLERELARERKARAEAESIGERSLRELYDKQRELLLLQSISEAGNELHSAEEVLQFALHKICAHTGWPVGHVYSISPEDDDLLLSTKLWHLDDPKRYENFKEITESIPLPRGVGLPGRVLAEATAIWSLNAGFAFPIIFQEKVVSVMEFFSDQIVEPDENLLAFVKRVSLQLSRVIERERAAELLKNSEQEFRRVWEESHDGMRLTDGNGTMLLVNKAFCRMVGKTAEELLGKPFSVIYEASKTESVLAKHRERFQARNVAPLFERELLLWHGRKVWFELSNSFLELPSQPTHLLSLFRDITDRKIAEEQLHEFAARLENSNRELQDFAYVASHDLQEPLRKVAVFGDRLKSKCGDALGEEGRDYVERMQKAAGRMQSLISDLLSFSRVTRNPQPFVPVNLQKVTMEVLSDLETSLEEAGGKIEMGILPTIEADALHMRQLFQNLIGNALKFRRPEEKPLVKINAEISHDKNQRAELGGAAREIVTLTVADNGIGFDERYLDKIFQVFQRLHGREAYVGTGIGLAIARKIVEHHGGEITAKSKPGEGAVFIVKLPVNQIKKPT